MTARPTDVRYSWFRNAGNFCFRNLESRASESRIQVKESGIPPTIGNWNPDSNEKASGIQSLESGTHKVDLSWITLHGTGQQLWLVDLASKVWKQCYGGTTFVESSKKTGLQMQYFLIHAIDVTSVKVTRWSSVKSYSTGNVTNFSYDLSYSDFTAPCRSRIKLHQNRKMSQVIAAAFGFVIAHPFYLTTTSWPPNRAKKKKKSRKEVHFPLVLKILST